MPMGTIRSFNKLHVAIIGGGLMGRWHSHAASRLGARIAGIVDRDEDAARRLAIGHCGASSYGSLDHLFDVCVPDFVHVCTPSSTHFDFAHKALQRGANVICEKPLAADATQTRELLEHARACERLIVPVHQFIAQKSVRKLKSQLSALGEIRRVSFEFFSAGIERAGDLSGDEIVADILPHPLSIATHIWPHWTLNDLDWQVVSPQDGELSCQADVDGVALHIAISMSVRPTRCTMSVLGTAASAHFDFFHGFSVRFDGLVSRRRKICYPFTDSLRVLGTAAANLGRRLVRREFAYPGLRQLISDAYASAEDSQNPEASYEEILAIAVARDEILRALK